MSRQSIMMWLRLNIPNKIIVIVMLKKRNVSECGAAVQSLAAVLGPGKEDLE